MNEAEPVNLLDSDNPNTERRRNTNTGAWAVFLVVFTLVCWLLICSMLGMGYGVFALSRSAATAVANLPNPGTPLTPHPILTGSAGGATSQGQAQAVATSAAQWSVTLVSNFDLNTENWPAGTVNDNTYGSITRRVSEGKYSWEVNSTRDVMWYAYPEMNIASDFILTTNIQRTSDQFATSYGVVFRITSGGSYYYFNLSPDQQDFAFALVKGDEWIGIIGRTYNAAINQNGVNKITVIATGPNFSFFINDQLVATATDSNLRSGRVGIGVGIGEALSKVSFEFDDFELKEPLSVATSIPVLTPRATSTQVITTTPIVEMPFAVNGRIVYQSGGDLFYVSADSSNNNTLTSNIDSIYRDASPSWSPSGNNLVFTRNFLLYTMEVAKLITTSGGNLGIYRVSDTTWSPNGEQIALIGLVAVGGNQSDIFIVEPGANNPVHVTNSSALELEPCWSADSSQIAFVTVEKSNYLIQIIDVDGTNLRTLTDPIDKAQNPDWSPDGEWIAFTSQRDDNKEIYLIHPDGTGLTRLTDNAADDFDPTWSPDGQSIAFVSNRDGKDEIYIMRADGTDQTRLTNNIANERDLDWGP